MKTNAKLYVSYFTQSIFFFLLVLIPVTALLEIVGLMNRDLDLSNWSVPISAGIYTLVWVYIFFLGSLFTNSWRLEFRSRSAAFIGSIVRLLVPWGFGLLLYFLSPDTISPTKSLSLVVQYTVVAFTVYMLWIQAATWSCTAAVENRLLGTATIIAAIRSLESISRANIQDICIAVNFSAGVANIMLQKKGLELSIPNAYLMTKALESGQLHKFCEEALNVVTAVAQQLYDSDQLSEQTLKDLSAHQALASLQGVGRVMKDMRQRNVGVGDEAAVQQ